jgi:hypothetical protein
VVEARSLVLDEDTEVVADDGGPEPGLYRVLVREHGKRHWKKIGKARVHVAGRIDFQPFLSRQLCPKDCVLEFALSQIPTKRERLRVSKLDRRQARLRTKVASLRKRQARRSRVEKLIQARRRAGGAR